MGTENLSTVVEIEQPTALEIKRSHLWFEATYSTEMERIEDTPRLKKDHLVWASNYVDLLSLIRDIN